MTSTHPTVSAAPQKRCAIARMGETQYLFVVMPKQKSAAAQVSPLPAPVPPPPPAPVIEDLFVFNSAPSPAPTFNPDPLPPIPPPAAAAVPLRSAAEYNPGDAWSEGSVVVPVVVTGNGELRRSLDFKKMEFDSLTQVYATCGPFDAVAEFYAVFGCLVLDRLYLLVATEIQCAVRLPFRGVIQRVMETSWVPFDLPGVAPVKTSPQDRTRLREFEEYTFRRGYYYSDEVDLRLQFPFFPGTELGSLPNFHCDWSQRLRDAFCAASLRPACSVLIRGFVDERVVAMKDRQTELHVMLLGRQSEVNPGPRFLSRGLNPEGGAGNEHFYEYVMWKRSLGDTAVTYARHAILRGTIPVHWTTQVSSMSISEPAMIFCPDKSEVLKGSSAYFENVFATLQWVMNVDSDGNTTRHPQVRCINLLRLVAQNGEEVLAKHYLDAVRAAEPAVRQKFPRSSLDLVHVDWLNIIKEYCIHLLGVLHWLPRETRGP